MIPSSYIQAWSTKAPWPDARQIEQDLIISRALCDQFAMDRDKLIACFDHYLALEGKPITRAVAEQRMLETDDGTTRVVVRMDGFRVNALVAANELSGRIIPTSQGGV